MYEGAETAIMVDLLVGSTIETSKKGLWRTFSFRVIYSHLAAKWHLFYSFLVKFKIIFTIFRGHLSLDNRQSMRGTIIVLLQGRH